MTKDVRLAIVTVSIALTVFLTLVVGFWVAQKVSAYRSRQCMNQVLTEYQNNRDWTFQDYMNRAAKC